MQSTQRHYNIKLFALLERNIFKIIGNGNKKLFIFFKEICFVSLRI